MPSSSPGLHCAATLNASAGYGTMNEIADMSRRVFAFQVV
jgi:hypothetical protein